MESETEREKDGKGGRDQEEEMGGGEPLEKGAIRKTAEVMEVEKRGERKNGGEHEEEAADEVEGAAEAGDDGGGVAFAQVEEEGAEAG